MSSNNKANVAFAFVCGLHFALLQFSYFFLMEAFLTSQYLSYFIALFFWLCGFLVGLKLQREGWFPQLLVLGVAAYYTTWGVMQVAPFHPLLYPTAGACSVASGLLPGYFFPLMSRRFPSVSRLLFHENNGFILGILIALKASIYCGSWFLAGAPLLGAALVFIVRGFTERHAASSTS